MQKCTICRSLDFIQITAKFTYYYNDKFLIVDKVPCKECVFCGERTFDVEVKKKIEEEFEAIHYHGKPSLSKISVPFEAYSDFINL